MWKTLFSPHYFPNLNIQIYKNKNIKPPITKLIIIQALTRLFSLLKNVTIQKTKIAKLAHHPDRIEIELLFTSVHITMQYVWLLPEIILFYSWIPIHRRLLSTYITYYHISRPTAQILSNILVMPVIKAIRMC